MTAADVDAFIATQAETVGTTWTDESAFEAFLRSDDGRPFVMINLMEYRETAEYPEGYVMDADMTGVEAGARYGQSVVLQLLMR